MNNETSPNHPQLIDVGPTDLMINAIGCIILGSGGILANILILMVIYFNKCLQSSCFILIASESFCSTIMAIGFFIDGLLRLGESMNFVSFNRSRTICFLQGSPLVFGIPASAVITCLIGIDRLISIERANAYQSISKKFVPRSLRVTLVWSICSTLIGALANYWPLNEQIFCPTFFLSLHPIFFAYFLGVNLFFCAFGVIIYGWMLARFEWKCRCLLSTMTSLETKSQTFVALQTKVLPTVKFLIAFYIVTSVIPEIVINTASGSGSYYLPMMQIYANTIKACSPFAEILALGCRNQQFRECTKKLLFRSKQSSHHQSSVRPFKNDAAN